MAAGSEAVRGRRRLNTVELRHPARADIGLVDAQAVTVVEHDARQRQQ